MMRSLVLLLAIFGAMSVSIRAEDSDANVLASVKELKAQQAQIADNETKIEAKVADLAEAIRTARIFTARAGGPHKPAKR
jgi:hypothetical protein